MFNWFKKKPDGPPPLDWRTLNLELAGSKDFGPCECCGHMSRRVWGYVSEPEGALAAFGRNRKESYK